MSLSLSLVSRPYRLRSLLVGIALSLSLVVTSTAHETSPTPLAQCNKSLETTKLALTMWFVDHDDNYPDKLGLLVPDYLVKLLKCPTANGRDYDYLQESSGESFLLTCTGDHSSEEVSAAPSTTSDPDTEAQVRSFKPD